MAAGKGKGRCVAAKLAGRGKRSKTKPSKKRGAAEPLLGEAWSAFLQHLATTGPTWALIALSLAHLLRCRITEVLRLQLQDIQWEGKKIRVRELKGHAEMAKPLSRAAELFLQKLKEENGRKIPRTRKWGSRGLITFSDWWQFPKQPEELFPSVRSDSKKPHRNKETWKTLRCFLYCSPLCPLDPSDLSISELRMPWRKLYEQVVSPSCHQ